MQDGISNAELTLDTDDAMSGSVQPAPALVVPVVTTAVPAEPPIAEQTLEATRAPASRDDEVVDLVGVESLAPAGELSEPGELSKLADDQQVAQAPIARVTADNRATRVRPARLVARGPLPQARSLATWLLVVRPHALLFAVAPVLVALAALAARGARISWSLGVAAALAIVLAQAGCSAIDAFLEHQRRQRAVQGGDSTVAATPSPLIFHGIYPLDALRAGCIFLLLAGVAAVPLVVAGGLPVLVLGLCAAAVGLLYSAGPYALKLFPVGDVLLFAGLGPGIVAFVALSQRQAVSPLLISLGVLVGLYMLASVFAAHMRDTARLRALGRHTVASLLSERQVRLVCAACVVVPYVVLLALGLPVGGPHALLLVFLSLPAAMLAVTGVLRAAPGEPQALVVRQLGRAYGLFALWLVVGLVAMAIWINLP